MNGATCVSCGKPIIEFSLAHCLNQDTAKTAKDERYIHCSCNGCTRNEFGDYMHHDHVVGRP